MLTRGYVETGMMKPCRYAHQWVWTALFHISTDLVAGFQKNPKSQEQEQEQEQERGIPGLSLHSHRIPMGGLLIGCEYAGKNRLMRSRGFRGISSTGKEPPVCGIPRPLDRAGVFPPFLSPTQTLIPLVYDAPAKKWLRCPPFRRCGRFAAV